MLNSRARIKALTAEILRLYPVYLNAKKVARQLGISDGPVRRILREAGLELRATPGQSDEERWWFYVSPEPNTGCWIWIGGENSDGYAHFSVRDTSLKFPFRKVPAYRWYWEHLNGPVPDGLQLDHLCRHRWCVNPDHLEPVTQYENHRRAPGSLLNRMLRGEVMGIHAKRALKKAVQDV